MTWHPGVMTEPAGHQSTAKECLVVVCDVCELETAEFSQAVVDRAGTEGIHRLLLRRGWTADLTSGEDACPGCALVGAA